MDSCSFPTVATTPRSDNKRCGNYGGPVNIVSGPESFLNYLIRVARVRCSCRLINRNLRVQRCTDVAPAHNKVPVYCAGLHNGRSSPQVSGSVFRPPFSYICQAGAAIRRTYLSVMPVSMHIVHPVGVSGHNYIKV